jgi:hypothetical protein
MNDGQSGLRGGMTVDLLIHAIVTQTTILIAQLATSRGIRAPLAQIANQVFLDLAGELERQRVSRKVSADMFGLGLRTYRRKIQRLNESATDRGRSLWEVIREYLAERESATRIEILERFCDDDESQVKAVLHDLCESRLVVSSGVGPSATYRAVGGEELIDLQPRPGAEGLDELLLALIFREAPLTAERSSKRRRSNRSWRGSCSRAVWPAKSSAASRAIRPRVSWSRSARRLVGKQRCSITSRRW